MPEGDTLQRTADRLRAALQGRALVALTLHHARAGGRRPARGDRIASVEATGKHLLIRFEHGATLRTHLGMTGSWHLYRTGERWRKPRHLARAVIEVDGWTAVCTAAPVVELTDDATARSRVSHLGPDLSRADCREADIDAAVDRVTSGEVGSVLLDQRVACGVGNVYKSEALFACGVDPFADVAALDRTTIRHVLATASRLLRANVQRGGPRRTTATGVAVYGRAGRPCPRCGTRIRARRQGEQARTTYWCPACQQSGAT